MIKNIIVLKNKVFIFKILYYFLQFLYQKKKQRSFSFFENFFNSNDFKDIEKNYFEN